ncbi:DMT family transporter [Acinetobacter sp. WCHAc010052]|uniref:DMT family transporter n=1 Tax=Acinetobacter sp. WCHAc010052 TaxID=2004647 RepID=UPI000B3C60A1|nr:DMT family transporter [Acinetobacter sp. WCHAc010052]AXY59572.1 DMT family transporter [Acinetobacter sp. WCHAc010052]
MNMKTVGAIAVLCLIWGSLWGLVKFSLQIFPPFLFIAARLILAGLTLLVVQRMLGKSILPAREDWNKLIISSLMLCVGFYATQTFAMQFVDSGLSAVLVFTMPIFIAVLAHYILNEHLSRQKILGLVFGALGLISILWPQLHHIHMNLALLGQGMLIGVGFMWALTTVYMKKYFASYDKLKLTIWQMLLGGGLILIGALILEPVHLDVWTTPFNVSILFYISVIGTGASFVMWNWIVSQVDTFVASISIMSIPVLSLIFGCVFWHEPLTVNILIGAVLILSGIVCSSVKIRSFKTSDVIS